MFLRLAFVFCLVAVFSSAGAEPPIRSTPLDPLSELGRLSEEEILIIEHSLAALYYYPNSLTGKPSAKLVEAIKDYQKSRSWEYPTANGLLNKRQIEILRSDGLIMGGKTIWPSDGRAMVSRINDNTIIAKGLLVEDGQFPNNDNQEYAYIVCQIQMSLCQAVTNLFISGSNYSITLSNYNIISINQNKILAHKSAAFSSSLENGIAKETESDKCREQFIEIDLAHKTALIEVRKNPALVSNKSCEGIVDEPRITKIVSSHNNMRLSHYFRLREEAQNQNMGQADQLYKLFDAVIGWIKEFYENPR